MGVLGDENPHTAGLCGCLSLCLGIALFNPGKPRLVALSVACAGLGAATVLGSLSRTAILATVAAAFILLLLELPQRRGILPRWAPIGLFAISGIAAVLAYTFLVAGERESRLASRRLNSFFGHEASVDLTLNEYRKARVAAVYEDYWGLLERSPVLGNGKSITGASDERASETHNYYLRLMVETGFVGLLLYLAMAAVVLRSCFRLYRYGHPHLVRVMGLLCLLFTTVLLVSAMASDVFIAAQTAEVHWLLVGMTMSLERMGCYARGPRPVPQYG